MYVRAQNNASSSTTTTTTTTTSPFLLFCLFYILVKIACAYIGMLR
jgi:hypothetical protein